MSILNVRDFRSNMAAIFDRTDAGEKVFIRRRNNLYAIVPVTEDELDISPELAAKIERARQDHHEGKTLAFDSAAEAQKCMDEL